MIFGAKVVNMTTLIGPKRAHQQQTHIFATYFEIQEGEPDILGSFRGHFGSLWNSLGSLYAYECDFKIILRHFQILIIFPTYFDGFIKRRGCKKHENQ